MIMLSQLSTKLRLKLKLSLAISLSYYGVLELFKFGSPKFYGRLCFHGDMSEITLPIFTISAKNAIFSPIKI